MSAPTCIDLFAGAGGLMVGLEGAGFRTLLANEVHPHPCLTLRRNFPGVPVIEGPIQEFSGKGLLEAAGHEPSTPVDLVAGGPPCQGFSTAGLKDRADPRNSLIGEFLRVVGDIRPRAFLLENVTGLVSMHDGRLFENVLDELDGLGYQFRWKFLHAADYGVPQMRRRLVVIGAREGEAPPFPAPTHEADNGETLFDTRLLPYTTCGDALGDVPLLEPGEVATEYEREAETDYQRELRKGSCQLFNHEASKHRQATMDYYALVPPGGHWLDIPPELRKAKQGMQRWPVDGLARTITTEPTDFLHPVQHRIPTVRELARIQSFPDRFEFLGQRTTGNRMRRLGYCSQTQQVGNAIPPLLARAVGLAISTHWDCAEDDVRDRGD